MIELSSGYPRFIGFNGISFLIKTNCKKITKIDIIYEM